MALSDFWEIKDNQVFAGKPLLNVYHVTRILAGANANAVGQAFIKTVLEDHLLALQPVGLSRTTIEVTNLGDVTDFISLDSSTLPGQHLLQTLPGFNAATIQFNRTRTDMKNGRKGFCVGSELDSDNGVWTPAFLALLAAMAVAILDPWENLASPGVDQCDFVILKRFCVVPAEDPCTQYRLPNTSAEIDANFYNPNTAIVRANVRSQVSRKVL